MRATHRRTWSVIEHGLAHEASSYRSQAVKLESERAGRSVFRIIDWVTGGLGILGSDPQYRILVTRLGTEQSVGMREARTLSQARKQLAEVDAILATSSEADVRAKLALEF